MTDAARVRARWLAQLLSTEPADRGRAEAAVRDLYRSAGFAPPRYFVWFDSPLEASWTVALLIEPQSSLWRNLLSAAARSAPAREKMEQARARLCQALAEPDWAGAVAAAGAPMGSCWTEPGSAAGFVKSLQSEVVMARARLHRGAMPGLDTASELHRAESHLLASARGVLATQPHWHTTGAILSTSFLNMYSFLMMAADEANAGEPPPPVLRAAWTIARSAGLWWPFTHAALLSDRPAEVHTDEQTLLHRGDGPAAAWRDGTRVYAWHGQSMPEEWILHPERIAPGQLKQCDPAFRDYVKARAVSPAPARRAAPSRILKAGLPADPAARLERLREHASGSLPFFERYMAGEHETVWAELVALGPAVREDPRAADALAVAYETMRRVEANVRTVVARLQAMHYHFKTRAMYRDDWLARAEDAIAFDPAGIEGAAVFTHMRELLENTEKMRGRLAEQVAKMKRAPRDDAVRAHVPPGPRVRAQIRRLEKLAGTLPLSLRAFYEVVGSVDWVGHHPSLAPPEAGPICPDPLVVFSLDEVLAEWEGGMADEGMISIAPDDLHKADQSGGAPYEIAVPDLRADAELLNEAHHLFFVDYLRLCFRSGGFPGYEGMDRGVPPEIGELREGLLEF